MDDCLFCKIVKGEIPSTKVFENKHIFAFKDINPQAENHLLFIHKEHTKNVHEMARDNIHSLGRLFHAISEYTENESNLYKNGYRVVSNIGESAGQTVFHAHIHVLADTSLGSFGK